MGLRIETELCRMLNVRYPVVLAGMAGGPSTPELAAAVSGAGGLGSLGAAYMEPEAIRKAIAEVRRRTDAPFAVNLFAVPMEADNTRTAEVQRELDRFRDDLGIPPYDGKPLATADLLAEQAAVLLEERVPVISTAMGVLPPALIRQAHDAGLKVIAMATTVREAELAERAGCDAVVAQGSEAGGHRGTFDVSEQPMGANIGLFALVPQIVDRVSIPVIAAGGIMDGRGLAAALALGASGVQMGTRFLTAAESGASAAYRQALLDSTEESSVLTRSFSGRPARGIRNEFVKRWDKTGIEPLPFPTQNAATRDIRNAAAAEGNADYLSLWAGQGTRMLTSGQSAADIVAETIRQARSLLE